ncbi:hypothetical protein ACFL1H_02065 [Nanoarchaeota archaeon]
MKKKLKEKIIKIILILIPMIIFITLAIYLSFTFKGNNNNNNMTIPDNTISFETECKGALLYCRESDGTRVCAQEKCPKICNDNELKYNYSTFYKEQDDNGYASCVCYCN